MARKKIQVQETDRLINFVVNGKAHQLMVKPHWTLSFVLRSKLGLTGTKEACDEGACGSCTVLVEGQAVPSCMMLAIEQDGKRIETIEGLSSGDKLHPIQEAWMEEYGAQCGFCSPGMIMSAKGLLDRNARPTIDEIKDALAGNLCICSNYEHIIKAVQAAAEKLRGR
jgi:aerobic-type carbon monoxide dehydrogenase small subunit (CoxS/CutS family)